MFRFLIQSGVSIEDPLTQVLRSGARRLLADAVEAEVAAFIAEHVDLSDEAGRRRVVRHGYQPEREVQTGIGAVAVRRPRFVTASRGPADRIRFTSSILPPIYGGLSRWRSCCRGCI